MSNADMPAMPVTFEHEGGDVTAECYGVTKREYLAAMAMQGILAARDHNTPQALATSARRAVSAADALLNALEERR